MLNRLVIAMLILTVCTFAVAQQNSGQEAAVGPNSTTTCSATFTFGSGHNLTQFCVTVNGNITQFSRGGDEYIQVGGVGEGYGICDFTASPAVSYFDYAFNESGNWKPSTFTSTAAMATSKRTTADGIWQLTNKITKVAATATDPGTAKVSVKIKNMTGVVRNIIFDRQADVDFMRSGGVADFKNDFDFTLDTSYGVEPGFKSGLSLVNNTFSFPYDAFAQNTPGGPDPCNLSANLAPQPFVGDGSIVQAYALTVPAGGTVTILMTYRPM